MQTTHAIALSIQLDLVANRNANTNMLNASADGGEREIRVKSYTVEVSSLARDHTGLVLKP